MRKNIIFLWKFLEYIFKMKFLFITDHIIAPVLLDSVAKTVELVLYVKSEQKIIVRMVEHASELPSQPN